MAQDLSEVIADVVMKEVDFRTVVRNLRRMAYGLPTYHWVDERGRTMVADAPPDVEVGRYVVVAHLPSDIDQVRAATKLKEWVAPKQVRHHVELGAPKRTAIDQYLDGLSAPDVHKFLGAGRQADDVEVERVEDTVPAEK